MGKYSADVDDHLVLPAVVSLTPGSEHFRRQAQRRVASPVSILLIIDTGSKRSTLIPGIVRHLDPEPGQHVRLVTPQAVGRVRLFWVRLSFPEAGLASFDHVQVARLAMPPELAQFHGLLGRDLLRQLESFDYEGRRGATPFAIRLACSAGCGAGCRCYWQTFFAVALCPLQQPPNRLAVIDMMRPLLARRATGPWPGCPGRCRWSRPCFPAFAGRPSGGRRCCRRSRPRCRP